MTLKALTQDMSWVPVIWKTVIWMS